MRKHLHILVLCIFTVLMHGIALESIPRGLFLDEFSIGANAASIAHTGLDEHGHSWPLFFEAFGEYKNPIYIYSTSILFKLFGVSDLLLRGTSLLWFLILCIGSYALWKHLFKSKTWASIGWILLIPVPWLFTVSRVSFEVISHAAMLPWLLLWSAKHLEGKKPWWQALLLGLAWGISIYSYSTARLLSPLSIVLLCTLLIIGKRYIQALWCMLGGSIGSLPLLWSMLYVPEAVFGRFKQITFLGDSPWWEQALQFGANYLSYFDPLFLFLQGDPNLRHHSSFGGVLGIALTILFILGTGAALWKKRTDPSWQFIVLILVSTPIAAALTEPYHLLRVLIVVIPICTLAVLGLRTLWTIPHKEARTALCLAIGILWITETSMYQWHWWQSYPVQTTTQFENYGMRELFEEGRKEQVRTFRISEQIQEKESLITYYSYAFPDLDIAGETEKVVQVPWCLLSHVHEGSPASKGADFVLSLKASSTILSSCYNAHE